jgi:DNA-binding LacI/PurR family transcriptional regulator
LNNNAHLFKNETRKKVLDAARELGYRPNSAARTMRSGRFGSVAILQSVDFVRSNLPAGLLDGIHDALLQTGQVLILGRLPDEKLTSEGHVPKILQEWTVDGLIIDYNINAPPAMADLIREHDIPSVWINAKFEADAVRPDDFGAGKRAVDELVKRGHRRIAYVDRYFDPPQVHYSRRDRREGYLAAMKSAGLQPQSVTSSDRVSGVAAIELLKKLLAAKDRPTAIIAYSDENGACAAVVAGRDLGMDVPRDLSVITFSDKVVVLPVMPVATMLVPVYEVGRAAVEMLCDKIVRPAASIQTKVVPFEFDPAETIAKAP